jgi:hypothetical protein
MGESLISLETSVEVEKILHSECFRGKVQMKSLLALLLRHWDSQAALKPDRIVAELWPGESSQKSSADVAAAMARLRRTLELYYAGEGEDDAIIIRLPDRSVRANASLKDVRWIQAETREAFLGAAAQEQVEPPPAAHEETVASRISPFRTGKRLWIVTGAVAVCVLAFFSFWFFPLDADPNAAQLSGNTLQIVNAKGSTLWSQSFVGGFWTDFYKDGIATRVWFADLGDGHKSVLLLYHSAEAPETHSSTLICYSHRGKELWRWTPGRVLPELGNEPAVFIARTLALIKSATGAPQIVILSGHYPRYPTQIALLDAHGKTVSEYWHSGQLDHMITADLDGNGRQEIIASGVANGYKEAVLVVLDPDKISGASTETGETRFQLHNLGVAHERFRLLFPRSDLNVATTTYNRGEEITQANGAIRLTVKECELNPYCRIWYEFDNKFSLRFIYLDDHFKDAHAAYFRDAPPSHRQLTEAELHQFEKIRCLVGCSMGYVTSLVEAIGH